MKEEYGRMNELDKKTIQIAYDTVASEYAARLFHELGGKPIDRKLLDLFAERVIPLGRACEIGCGPGEVAFYLKQCGVDIIGIDLSPNMIAEARRLNPDIDFQEGDVFALRFADNSLAGIVAFYLIVNFRKDDLSQAFAEMFCVLLPGGIGLLAFHIGTEILHLDEAFGHNVSIDFIFFEVDEIVTLLKEAGFEVQEVLTRRPYPEGVEPQTQRAYVFLRKPEKGLGMNS
jgi:ubiquinone/menaquinone biosynthesis C-methylase UbiE